MHEFRSAMNGRERPVPLARKSAGARTGPTGLAAIRIRREEARRCDQRREDRHLNIVDEALLRHARTSRAVPVLNVSSRGAMVECDLKPRIGARVDLKFADCNPTACIVRWLRGGRIGLEFDKETLIIGAPGLAERLVGGRRAGEHPTLAVKRERAPRQRLILCGDLHWRAGSMPVRLHNISSDGAMLHGTRDLETAEPVVLELNGHAIEGEVRWCRSRQIGVRFADAFDLAALAQPEEEPSEPDYLKPDYLKSDGAEDSPWFARSERLRPDDL